MEDILLRTPDPRRDSGLGTDQSWRRSTLSECSCKNVKCPAGHAALEPTNGRAKYAAVPDVPRSRNAWRVISVNHTICLADNTQSIVRHTWDAGAQRAWLAVEVAAAASEAGVLQRQAYARYFRHPCSEHPNDLSTRQLPVWPAKKPQCAVQLTINGGLKSRRINPRHYHVSGDKNLCNHKPTVVAFKSTAKLASTETELSSCTVTVYRP